MPDLSEFIGFVSRKSGVNKPAHARATSVGYIFDMFVEQTATIVTGEC